MKGLNKKIARDIRKNKIQFFNIFIMIFLGVFVFAGIHAYMDGMKYSADDYYKNNNLEDIWVSGLSFSDEDFDNVKKIDNVHNVERQTIINTTVKEKEDVTLETIFIESNDISKMYGCDLYTVEKRIHSFNDL